MKMEDIARLAGVSKSAVSLALNGKDRDQSETRERVLEIARESGYTPKPRAAHPIIGEIVILFGVYELWNRS